MGKMKLLELVDKDPNNFIEYASLQLNPKQILY